MPVPDFWLRSSQPTASVKAVEALSAAVEFPGSLWCPLVMANIAIENGDLEWIYPLKLVMFHSYVKLPEAND